MRVLDLTKFPYYHFFVLLDDTQCHAVRLSGENQHWLAMLKIKVHSNEGWMLEEPAVLLV